MLHSAPPLSAGGSPCLPSRTMESPCHSNDNRVRSAHTGPLRICLHVCCGPCATVAIERLMASGTVLACWYNPNIYPPAEYRRRLAAARKVCEYFGVELAEGPYEHDRWLHAVRGLEEEPEGGSRCRLCIGMRLEAAAQRALAAGCHALTTTLTLGPQKNVRLIHDIGREIADRAGLRWLEETFRKGDGFRRSVELSRQLDLYRQDYCGCEFSLRERHERT